MATRGGRKPVAPMSINTAGGPKRVKRQYGEGGKIKRKQSRKKSK